MTTHPWLSGRRAAGAAAALVALTAAGLTSAAPTTSLASPGSATAPVTSAGAAACISASSAQRVRADSGANGVDPNTLTPAQGRQAEARLTARLQQRRVSSQEALQKTTIGVYVHVIRTDGGKGGVSTKRIQKQIDVLNAAYAGKTSKYSTKTPFTFKLKGITRTNNSEWHDWTPPTTTNPGDDVAPKTALHQGGPNDLNLYTASFSDATLGYATFPWRTTLARDGVVVLNRSLPDGSAKPYDKGDTATHEVGHWLGLLHTFQNGCAAPGDYVDDTPAQADDDNIFSCSSKLDTCASKGKDPVRNFMSYGEDTCLNRFTKGQVARMSAVWQAYRAPGATL